MLDIDTRYPINETPLEQGVTMGNKVTTGGMLGPFTSIFDYIDNQVQYRIQHRRGPEVFRP